jgi:hypothetical protein
MDTYPEEMKSVCQIAVQAHADCQDMESAKCLPIDEWISTMCFIKIIKYYWLCLKRKKFCHFQKHGGHLVR